MNKNSTNLNEIIRKINGNQILLPDFQRMFVWKDEEQQKKLIASVFAKMPIGSILLLESKPNDYLSKVIGCKKKADLEDSSKVVEFLLDGQQRVTVLANVFSNVIHDQCEKISDLISPSLKNRFFLRVPRWSTCNTEQDLFGVYNFKFSCQNAGEEDPNFLSGDIYSFIECFGFLKDDGKPYNPNTSLSTALDDFCLGYSDGYLIPLFLLAANDGKNKDISILRLETIVENIADKIGNEIINYCISVVEEEKIKVLDLIFHDDNIDIEKLKEMSELKIQIQIKARTWKHYMLNYLNDCVKNIDLHKIVVSEANRDRAIDIYENLNRGGVSLSTFDLVMAKVAKVSKENFYERLINFIIADKSYIISIVPETIESTLHKYIGYNATMAMECFNEDKNEISSAYIDIFLNVLSLYCTNKDFNPSMYKIDSIKRNQILRLSPHEINDNCELVCTAIDRAMFFFQTRCGIRNIREVNYQLMLTMVATVFIKDKLFNDKNVHKKLEAWYWASVFSGEYDKDQNVTMINHLQSIIKMLEPPFSVDWIINIHNYILDAQNFSDKSLLLMEKVNEDRYPKKILRNIICQYLLAKTYADMFEPDKIISVFLDESKDLEAHHIIPLGSTKKISESTSILRKDLKHICNSPLNFVYITKKSNNEISAESLNGYITKICVEAKAKLYINAYTDSTISEVKIRQILENRYNDLRGDIRNHIKKLLN